MVDKADIMVHTRLTERQHRFLKALAAAVDKSMAGTVRMLLDAEIARINATDTNEETDEGGG